MTSLDNDSHGDHGGRGLDDARVEQCLPAPPEYEPDWALFLDLDGTVLEIAERPSAVQVNPVLPALIRHLHDEAGSALALVSGRSLSSIDALFPGFKPAAAGLHGIERRDAQGVVHLRRFGQEQLREAAARLLPFVAAHPGVLLEDKGLTLALHYRGAPQFERETDQTAQETLAALGPEFELQRGKMVFELKPGAGNKGTAIEAFMGEPPFAGRRPVFLGDDLTDEHGFDVVNRLGGISIKVGEGATAAQWRISNPATAREWLTGWARRFGRSVRERACPER